MINSSQLGQMPWVEQGQLSSDSRKINKDQVVRVLKNMTGSCTVANGSQNRFLNTGETQSYLILDKEYG